MYISQMHAQLAELAKEYERISSLGKKISVLISDIENTEAHLANLKFNLSNQRSIFKELFGPQDKDNQ